MVSVSRIRRPALALVGATFLLTASSQPAGAQVRPDNPAAQQLAYAHPDLYIPAAYLPADEAEEAVWSQRLSGLRALGAPSEGALLDLRGGTYARLLLAEPLIPGSGVGNSLSWAALGQAVPAGPDALRDAAGVAFRSYLELHASLLGIDAAEISRELNIALPESGRLVQIYAPRVVDGIPVRESFVTAIASHGNLILLGARNWGPMDVSTEPAIAAEDARSVVRRHVNGRNIRSELAAPELVILPTAPGGVTADVAPGEGYRYRLAWALTVALVGDHGSWEGLVDAHSGELLQFADRNQYATRRTVGGIFPVSNDGNIVDGVPDGIEQPGHPMPFADIQLGDGSTAITNSAGLFEGSGPFQTTLAGPFVRINDSCGPIAEVTTCRDLDLGVSDGTNCTVPEGRSPGDTHSARTGFYEVNRIVEQAKGWVSETDVAGIWLNAQLTANMNINNTCNAFWTPVGGTINFYREGPAASGTVICRNTGEIAAVFDHEWGHGLDNNDNIPLISSPGEAYADITAILRLNTSCIGRGFFKSLGDGSQEDQVFCGGNGDPCTECTGVREDDWMKRASGLPHDIDWVLSQNQHGAPGGCGTFPDVLPQPLGLGSGPCGYGTHCEGTIVGEAVWDLLKRDLRCHGAGWEPGGAGSVGGGQCLDGATPSIDENTALEMGARYFYQGATSVHAWYTCVTPAPPGGNDFGGCNADSGYMSFLAVDDDNGTLLDGTPHMEAIFDAFNRHQLACPVPLPADSGCAGAPTQAPAIQATALVNGAEVSWSAVPGAQRYWVFRTEGVHGANFGKERIADVTGTSFTESGLLDGFEYFYTVIPVGASPSCSGPMSAAASVVPEAAADSLAPNLAVLPSSQPVTIETGDGDDFVDNCELASLPFVVLNDGSVPLTNVRLEAVRPVSHPQTSITTELPMAIAEGLDAACGQPSGQAEASFSFVLHGASHGDTLVFEVDVAADQLAAPVTGILTVTDVESDPVLGDLLFDFEDGTQEWVAHQGTFTRTDFPPPGAESTAWFMASSRFLDDQCDQARSPALRLTSSSTLSLHSQFDIEPTSDAPFDRANVGLIDLDTGERALVIPDGGARPYNLPDGSANGACVTAGQGGWNGPGPGWADATWSAAALGVDDLDAEGKLLQIDVAYGTDPLISSAGFQFDQVRVTDVLVAGPDQGSDECPVECVEIDDADPAVDYRRGWHRHQDPAASNGGYHRRKGSNTGGNGAAPTARVTFSGDSVTYFYATASDGGTADIYIDGVLQETLSYAGSGNPTFGHEVTYSGLGSGDHTLLIEHRTGAVYVDGFRFACDGFSGAQPDAAEFHSDTAVSTGSTREGPVLRRSVEVGSADQEISVVVEGSLLPLTVKLLDPAGDVIATGSALIEGLTTSGLDSAVTTTGRYTVEIVNVLGAFRSVEISIARMVQVN